MLDKIISLKKIEVYLLDIPQKSIFKSGIGLRKSKETLIVKWTDQEGRVGFGECSCRPDPYFSAEFLEASKVLIEKFIIPRLKPSQSYEEVLKILDSIRGWNFTKTAVEAAMYQVLKQQWGSSLLSDCLQSKPSSTIPVGISLGIYEDVEEFKTVILEAVAQGYKRVKFKIAPFINTKIFDQINPILTENKVYVSFDANGSFQAKDLDKLGYFVDTYDTCIEQPTAPHRFDILMEAKKKHSKLKVCFDEEVESIGDLVKLHQLNMLDELNLKVGRVGGINNSIQILNYCRQHNITCWMGGMFESGVGRLQNLELAAYMNLAKANDMSPSSRYFVEDIIAPEIGMENGLIDVAKASESVIVQEKIDYFSTQKNEYIIK